MPDYDFSTLNDTDLEELVCDLLNAENEKQNNGVIFRTYPAGKDRGIDFRHSGKGLPYLIVGQVKHYRKSGVKAMIRELRKKEKNKVIKLSPERYIFATSLELSVGETDEIFGLFKPYIQSLSDIYDRKSLNKLILRNPSVLDDHFKLWYSNTSVLRKILHFEQIGRSLEFTEEYLKKKLILYVETPELDSARTILTENKFIIISGNPGTGKTTLAELLVYEYIKNGFALTYVHDEIRDLEKALLPSSEKQVFYFDDFLGHNSYENEKARSSESALIAVLKRIVRAKNKFVIFTTRDFILNTAIAESQKLSDFDLKTKELTLSTRTHSSELKNKMLTNHIHFAELDEGLKKVISEPGMRRFITLHRNFSPRSLEYITLTPGPGRFSPDEYRSFIISNFDYPEKIWKMTYLNQIDEYQRLLLNTMFSLGNDVNEQILRNAFDTRLSYEAQRNNLRVPMYVYDSAFRKLYGGFIQHSNVRQNAGLLKFSNPSLTDFLTRFIEINNEEKSAITSSARYLSQLSTRFYKAGETGDSSAMPAELQLRLINFDFDIEFSPDEDHLLQFFMLIRYVGTNQAIKQACALLSGLEDPETAFDNSVTLDRFKVLISELENPELMSALEQLGMKLFAPMIDDEYELEELIGICEMITEKFKIKPSKLLGDPVFDTRGKIRDLFFTELETELESLKRSILSDSELTDLEEKFLNYSARLHYFGAWIPAFSSYFDYQDWFEIINSNQFRNARNQDRS